MIVGLAGQIASGKSVVAEEWSRLGAAVVSGDEIGKQVVERNEALRRKLAREFGSQILTAKGELRRRVLGRIVFGAPEKMAKLNSLVHPALLRELEKLMSRFRRKPWASVLVIDAALIFDWGLHEELDAVVVVESSIAAQIRRLRKLGFTDEDAHNRIKRQLPKSRQRELADFVLDNRQTLSELREKARRLYKKLLKSVDIQ